IIRKIELEEKNKEYYFQLNQKEAQKCQQKTEQLNAEIQQNLFKILFSLISLAFYISVIVFSGICFIFYFLFKFVPFYILFDLFVIVIVGIGIYFLY
ncbi:hypothetical protein P9H72_000357, partial [Campylobacter fetus]|nr:hypothetical protein [Campylobacter fetus]